MKLKQGLLFQILDCPNIPNKYTKSYLNLKNVFELEKSDNFTFDDELIKKFSDITIEFNSFLNKIPLKVIETYFKTNAEKLDDYIYLEYKGNEVSDMKNIDLFMELEMFFDKLFSLACEIANFYNIEIKLKNNKDSTIEMI